MHIKKLDKIVLQAGFGRCGQNLSPHPHPPLPPEDPGPEKTGGVRVKETRKNTDLTVIYQMKLSACLNFDTFDITLL